MIEAIRILKEGSYGDHPQEMADLKKVNFIYGPNGSGKTTISRVLDNVLNKGGTPQGSGVVSEIDLLDSEDKVQPHRIGEHCEVTWQQNTPLEVLVYNRDFVAKHFRPDAEVKGIYTFGGNVDVSDKIKEKSKEARKLLDEIKNLKRNLNGEDGAGGKTKEIADLEIDFTEMCWKAKTKFKEFKEAFTGAGTKVGCKTRYETEAKNNTAALLEYGAIAEKAKTVFSGDLSTEELIPPLHYDEVIALEENPILSKIVLGKGDVDIAAMITKLGNSDWVQAGIEFYDENDDYCPFCQQQTTQAFRDSLNEYFDETYTKDLGNIEALHAKYEELSKLIQGRLTSIADSNAKFLDAENLKEKQQRLDGLLATNLSRIEGKRKEPSANVSLEAISDVLTDISDEIETANKKAKENNETVANLAARKRELISQIWKRILEDTKTEAASIETKRKAVQAAIEGLENNISTKEGRSAKTALEIAELERKITSIKPTLDDINKLLLSFGFSNFSLAESDTAGFYKIVRTDGSDAKETLSEGEKSFITFLYFYQLIKGSFETSGSTMQRVVVFDDPVSSLDSDVLFIVSNLIKGVIAEIKEPTSSLAQIFLLTHNVYFHKEITFDTRRSGNNSFNDETYWTISKQDGKSRIKSHDKNPVTSSYEMLWAEIRNPERSSLTTQNVMRRILEHYFTFFGGIKPDKIIDKFSGKEKILCGSLFSWINDGSHFANDDLFIACDSDKVERYLIVFKKIFEETNHLAHYEMMRKGVDIVPTDAEDATTSVQVDVVGGI
jgi:wobble nucleotide-excising tRNase